MASDDVGWEEIALLEVVGDDDAFVEDVEEEFDVELGSISATHGRRGWYLGTKRTSPGPTPPGETRASWIHRQEFSEWTRPGAGNSVVSVPTTLADFTRLDLGPRDCETTETQIALKDIEAAKEDLLQWLKGRLAQTERYSDAHEYVLPSLKRRSKLFSDLSAYRDHLFAIVNQNSAATIARTRSQKRSIVKDDLQEMGPVQESDLEGLIVYMLFPIGESGEIEAGYGGTGTAQVTKSSKGGGWSRLGQYERSLQAADLEYFAYGFEQRQVIAMYDSLTTVVRTFASSGRPTDSKMLGALKSDLHILEAYVTDMGGFLDRRLPAGSRLSRRWENGVVHVERMWELSEEVAPVFADYTGLNLMSPLAQHGQGEGRKDLMRPKLEMQQWLCLICDAKLSETDSWAFNPLAKLAV